MKYRGNDITNSDWVAVVGIFLMLISACLFTYYYVITEINDCTSDPLDYAISQKINENYTFRSTRSRQGNICFKT